MYLRLILAPKISCLSPEVRTEISSELEEKTVHHHEGQEQKRPVSHQDVPYDPLSRFSVIHDLRSQVQDEIARWKAEKSIQIRQWDVDHGKWGIL